MTVYSDLPKRLRNYKWVVDENPCPEAADVIEALEDLVGAAERFQAVRETHPFDCEPMWRTANALSASLARLNALKP